MSEKNEKYVSDRATLTGVEHSDGRLAAVEEAKRTGLEFRSTGSQGKDVVPYSVAVEAGNEWSTSVVEERREFDEMQVSVDEMLELNNKKGQAHEDYSNGVIKRRRSAEPMEQAKRVQAILKRNEEVAKQHEERSNAMADASRSGEERRFMTAEQVEDGEPVTALGRMVKDQVTNIDETEERELFNDRSRIAYGEKSFKDFVDEEKSQKEPRSEERDVPPEHGAGELRSGGKNSAKQEAKKAEREAEKEAEKAQRDTEKAAREQEREREKAQRAEEKAEREAKREREKAEREAKREEQKKAEEAENNDSGDSQE